MDESEVLDLLMGIEKTDRAVVQDYDPNQPRDKNGRWTSVGGSSLRAKLEAERNREKIGQMLKSDAHIDEIASSEALKSTVDDMNSRKSTFNPLMPDEERKQFFQNRKYNNGMDLNEMKSEWDAVSRKHLEGKSVQTNREVYIVIGPPAAGKSTIAEPIAAKLGARIIDSDDIKKLIPEFEGGIGASAVHEESSFLGKAFLNESIDRGENILLPKVGDNAHKLQRDIGHLAERGYKVSVVNMQVTGEEAQRRNLGRYVQTGRLVPPAYVSSVGDKPSASYAAIDKSTLHGYANIDNMQPFGEKPTVLEAHGKVITNG